MLNPPPPLLYCGFRPFFLATALAGTLAMLAWGGFLLFGTALPAEPFGPVVWHARELLFGFTVASLAGFLLTAVPEFTTSRPVGPHTLLGLVLLWLGGRLAGLAGPGFGPWLVAACDITLIAALLAVVSGPLWRDPERRHTAFWWGLLVLLLVTAGYHVEALGGGYPMRWLLALVTVLMALIVVAMSRISMRIVNSALEERGVTDTEYLARPPRRNLAIVCIGLHGVAEFFMPGHPVVGWLALATAAALLNLTNDWHLGRVLLRRWVLMLYLVYWLMAPGYALMGVALLAGQPWTSAGRHLLMVGAMGIAVFAVLCIAGRAHAGLPPDERPWVPIGVAALLLAAGARLGLALNGGTAWLWASLAGWCLAFVDRNSVV